MLPRAGRFKNAEHTSGAKAALTIRLIAALKRCATQKGRVIANFVELCATPSRAAPDCAGSPAATPK